MGDRRRIWVVDNEEADRGLLVRILEPLGFEVTPFASGVDCLAGLRVCPPAQQPHAVFMDLAMPGLDGWATLRAIRTEGLSEAPAAIVSANAFDKALENDVGIAPEDAPHIFERFYRADPARTRQRGGTGLGLSIAKWVVDRHGGTFDVVSRPGLGTRVTVWLPPQ